MQEPRAAIPEWVVTREGRQVAFDPDAISQALYLATEALGRPNAFLARELADAVLHFLAREEERIPTTAAIEELVVKVVTGLDQPAVARAFADRPRPLESPAPPTAGRFEFPLTATPSQVLRDALGSFARQAVYSRDLAAALDDALLVLEEGEHPGRLDRRVAALPFDARDGFDLVRKLHPLTLQVGRQLVLDGPDWHPHAAAIAPALAALADVSECQVVVNLNRSTPPAWASSLGAGPLFAAEPADAERRPSDLAATLLQANSPRLTLHWHTREEEIPEALLRYALEGRPIAFVPERYREEVVLAEGVDRRGPAVLLQVGLNLPALLAWAGVAGEEGRFLEKLPSLARMAVRLGAQKRNFLRRQPPDERGANGYFLERARLLVVPLGLDAVLRTLTGSTAAGSAAAREVGQRLLTAVREALAAAARQAHLETLFFLGGLEPAGGHSPRKQLRAFDKLREHADQGRADLLIDPADGVAAAQEVLRRAVTSSEATLVTLAAPRPELRQGEFVSEESVTHGG